MITKDAEKLIFKLDTPHTSYVCGISDGAYLGHMYYGPRVCSADFTYMLRPEEILPPSERAREKNSFLNRFPHEYSFGNTGDFREPCFLYRTEDGQEGAELWFRKYEIFHGEKHALPGLPASFGECDELFLTCEDPVNDISVILKYAAFPDTDVITRSVEVVNEGDRPVCLTRVLSACLDMDDRNFRLLYEHGAWAREHIISKNEIPYAGLTVESRLGKSGHEAQPFAALISPDANEDEGEVYAMHFVYSGNFLAKVEKTSFDTIRFVMGIHPDQFAWKLAPGEHFQTPEVVLTYSREGIGGMTRNLHDFYREHLISPRWKYTERPVLINTWEAAYFEIDEERLLAFGKEAAKSGIEMLVVDDGWFGHGRHTDSGSLGDWFADPEKFPHGFSSFSEKIHEMGLKLGLWFEPEMVSADSDLYRAHPDWILHLADRTPCLCRDQLVLDFSNPEVIDAVYDRIASVIRSAKIDYVKWDMNRPLTDAGSEYLPFDRQGEVFHRHVLGVYELEGRLLKEFPDLLIENCSAGGARFDPGMLYFSPQIWTSDDMDPIERLSIEEGTAMLYPLSAMGAHVCKTPNDVSGRDVPFETRVLMALTGTFGYELDITKLSGGERSSIPRQIRLHKELEHLLQTGTYYRLESYRENGRYDSFEVLSRDGTEGVIFSAQVLAQPMGQSRMLRLKGLIPEAAYKISAAAFFSGSGKENRQFSGRETMEKEEKVGETAQQNWKPRGSFRGDALMYAGLPMPWMKKDFYMELLRFSKVG